MCDTNTVAHDTNSLLFEELMVMNLLLLEGCKILSPDVFHQDIGLGTLNFMQIRVVIRSRRN